MEGSIEEETQLEGQDRQSRSSEDRYLRIRQTRRLYVPPCPIIHNHLPFLTSLRQGMNKRSDLNRSLCTGL